VKSSILSALIRCPYTRESLTVAKAARTKTSTGRHLCQQRQLQGRRNRQRQPRQQRRTTVAKCASWRNVLASHWCRADIEHVDSIQDDTMMTKKTFRLSKLWGLTSRDWTTRHHIARVDIARLADRVADCTQKLQATISAAEESCQTGFNSLIVQHVRFFLGPTDVQSVAICLIWCPVVRSRDVRSRDFRAPLKGLTPRGRMDCGTFKPLMPPKTEAQVEDLCFSFRGH